MIQKTDSLSEKQSSRGGLTLPALCILESCSKIKSTEIFSFTLLYGASKGFMKAFKAFIKPSEAPQKKV